jgi:hypothetical protein
VGSMNQAVNCDGLSFTEALSSPGAHGFTRPEGGIADQIPLDLCGLRPPDRSGGSNVRGIGAVIARTGERANGRRGVYKPLP